MSPQNTFTSDGINSNSSSSSNNNQNNNNNESKKPTKIVNSSSSYNAPPTTPPTSIQTAPSPKHTIDGEENGDHQTTPTTENNENKNNKNNKNNNNNINDDEVQIITPTPPPPPQSLNVVEHAEEIFIPSFKKTNELDYAVQVKTFWDGTYTGQLNKNYLRHGKGIMKYFR